MTYSRYTISKSSCRNVCFRAAHVSQRLGIPLTQHIRPVPQTAVPHCFQVMERTYSLTSLHSGASDADIVFCLCVVLDFLLAGLLLPK